MSKIKLIETRFVKGKIIESDQDKLPDGVLCRVQYPICEIGQKNHNGRIYEMEVWNKVYESEDVKGKLARRNLFGNQEHPEDSKLRLNKDETSHIVSEIFTEGDTIKANLDVLPTDAGKFIDVLLKAGCEVGVSTRAEGELEEQSDDQGDSYQRVVPESYKFITVDFTADPSTLTSYPEDIKHNVVDGVKSGYESKTINRRVAMALLESVDSDEARKLEETIKKDGVSGNKKFNVGSQILHEKKVGKVKHVFSRSNKYICEFTDGDTVIEAEDIIEIMNREDATEIVGNEKECLNCSCNWTKSRIIVPVKEMRYTTCVECGTMYKYNEHELHEVLHPKKKIVEISGDEIYQPQLNSFAAKELFEKMASYMMMADDPMYNKIVFFRNQIDKLQDADEKEELKKYFESEFAGAHIKDNTAWDYYAKADENAEPEIEEPAVEETDGMTTFADDFEQYAKQYGEVPTVETFEKFVYAKRLTIDERVQLVKDLRTRLTESIKKLKKPEKITESQKEALIDKFEKAFPNAWVKPGDEFSGGGAVLWSGEGAEHKDIALFNYYDDDPKERTYQMGVHVDLVKWSEENGLYWEAHDAGTYLAYSDSDKDLTENKRKYAWMLRSKVNEEVITRDGKVELIDFEAMLKEMSNVEVMASIPRKLKKVLSESKTSVELIKNMLKLMRESMNDGAFSKAEKDKLQEMYETRINELEENYIKDIQENQLKIDGLTKRVNENKTHTSNLSENVDAFKSAEVVKVETISRQAKHIKTLEESHAKELKKLKETHAKELKEKLTSVVNETVTSTSEVATSKIKEITTKFTTEIKNLNSSHSKKMRKIIIEKKLQEANLTGRLPASAMVLLEQAKEEEIDDLICEFRYAIKEGMFHHVTDVTLSQEPEPENGQSKLLQQTENAVKFLN